MASVEAAKVQQSESHSESQQGPHLHLHPHPHPHPHPSAPGSPDAQAQVCAEAQQGVHAHAPAPAPVQAHAEFDEVEAGHVGANANNTLNANSLGVEPMHSDEEALNGLRPVLEEAPTGLQPQASRQPQLQPEAELEASLMPPQPQVCTTESHVRPQLHQDAPAEPGMRPNTHCQGSPQGNRNAPVPSAAGQPAQVCPHPSRQARHQQLEERSESSRSSGDSGAVTSQHRDPPRQRRRSSVYRVEPTRLAATGDGGGAVLREAPSVSGDTIGGQGARPPVPSGSEAGSEHPHDPPTTVALRRDSLVTRCDRRWGRARDGVARLWSSACEGMHHMALAVTYVNKDVHQNKVLRLPCAIADPPPLHLPVRCWRSRPLPAAMLPPSAPTCTVFEGLRVLDLRHRLSLCAH